METRVFPEFDRLPLVNLLHPDRGQETEDGGRVAPTPGQTAAWINKKTGRMFFFHRSFCFNTPLFSSYIRSEAQLLTVISTGSWLSSSAFPFPWFCPSPLNSLINGEGNCNAGQGKKGVLDPGSLDGKIPTANDHRAAENNQIERFFAFQELYPTLTPTIK